MRINVDVLFNTSLILCLDLKVMILIKWAKFTNL